MSETEKTEGEKVESAIQQTTDAAAGGATEAVSAVTEAVEPAAEAAEDTVKAAADTASEEKPE